MKNTFAKISPFQVDPEKIMETFGIRDDDFTSASAQEKESMVEMHKSISYWQDAWRRFKANTVSMVALFVFLLCLVFAFIGLASYTDETATVAPLTLLVVLLGRATRAAQYAEAQEKTYVSAVRFGLASAIVAHVTTNLLLALYVIHQGAWAFW